MLITENVSDFVTYTEINVTHIDSVQLSFLLRLHDHNIPARALLRCFPQSGATLGHARFLQANIRAIIGKRVRGRSGGKQPTAGCTSESVILQQSGTETGSLRD